MYKVAFRERTLKFLTKKLPFKSRKKVLKKIETLAKNPFTPTLDIKKLSFFKNLQKAYRLRIGNLRIIYELDTKKKKIIIYQIDYRRTTTY
ncbi:hypothetical protein COU96_02730 [Candidatus Shapirobacteria bacterium CG10_big_fil_rev_8_21_14_0_10_38_14]|uniref:Type II toxin-antitoxin system RelE/ParE family toxin n=1 Tax=Candidatus Shapirobacteria bacterium CG10_big_fil_rev_8_21_14_0_10_38_14 TaxID=1974483 RepID=A0A2M8L517_9BACT|nr:MAG: hypothetical protein COU96_02730 [Candidatus Shapirobacteria bacterium CG10_big_fil_rev_8_21_14_0_10_38_14]